MALKHFLAAVFAFALSAGAASSKTLTAEYLATSAVGSGSNHSMHLSEGIGMQAKRKYDFIPAGVLSFFDDGTATLIGRVVSQNNTNAYFDLAFDVSAASQFQI